MPEGEIAIGIDAGFDAMGKLRTDVVEAELFFPALLHLNRVAAALRQPGRLDRSLTMWRKLR
jgi:hypothetical protein